MPKISSEDFEKLLDIDGFEYVIESKDSEPIRIDLPNVPEYHQDDFDDRCEWLPPTNIFRFEYKGLKYKLLRNMGCADSNDGNFGAVLVDDESDEKIADLISSGDMETTIESSMSDDVQLNEDFVTKLTPYLECFEVVLSKGTEFEFLIFKILFENECLYDLSVIDERCEDSDDDDNDVNDDDDNDNQT